MVKFTAVPVFQNLDSSGPEVLGTGQVNQPVSSNRKAGGSSSDFDFSEFGALFATCKHPTGAYSPVHFSKYTCSVQTPACTCIPQGQKVAKVCRLHAVHMSTVDVSDRHEVSHLQHTFEPNNATNCNYAVHACSMTQPGKKTSERRPKVYNAVLPFGMKQVRLGIVLPI